MTDSPVPPDAVASLRTLLEQQAVELRRRLRRLDESGLARAAGDSREVLDRKDEAALELEQTVEAAEAHRDATALCDIEAALKRIVHGDYGRCVDCGDAIALARLQIEPAAERCIDCQQAREQRP